jgi:23S rRNA (cytidine1920-2'-O)/16S rRNA (cytidine1409-2'-O)-methyltransferase
MKKERLDKVLLDKKLVKSREQGKGFIMAGSVLVDGGKITKAGTLISPEAKIEIKTDAIGYVSRGGLKLKEAIENFNINISNKICLDVGASTGGFTDCLLQNGARLVYALDVGYGQLDWKLREDKRVINIEKQNIRYFTKDNFLKTIEDKIEQIAALKFTVSHLQQLLPDIATIDVSFISLEKVLPQVYELMKPAAEIIVLIKPQFEAGREKVGKGGVVRDKKVHQEVIKKIRELAKNTGLAEVGVIPSPITGPAGNIEYLIYLKKEL